MRIQTLPITGAENLLAGNAPATDPLACLTAFYAAFNQRDLVRMEGNWSHPLGGIKRGWADIRAVYERIFAGPARVYVEFHDYSLHATEDMFCAVGRKRGYVGFAGQRLELAIRTTRIYRKENHRWKQLHHHGSIDNAELLARYQSAVINSVF